MNKTEYFKRDIITSAKIMVVGCGALGNEVLKNLALMNVGKIVIVDFDIVENHNLNRSVLFVQEPDSVGRSKVKVASEVIKKMNPQINVQTIKGDICYDVGLGLIREMDVIIACVDNRWARYCINRLCMRAGVSWIDGGISTLEGTVKLFEPYINCYACTLSNQDIKEMKSRFSCAGNIRRAIKSGSAPTTPVIASIIGAIQVQEALKLIHNKKSDEEQKLPTLSDKMLFYDGIHLTYGTPGFSAYDDDCALHDKWTPVIKSNISEKTTVKEALHIIKLQLAAYFVELHLINDCFVDFIYDKDTNEAIRVMLPGRKVEEFILNSPELSGKKPSDFYQNEISRFHHDSQYKDLTLEEIGIPPRDILKLKCGIKGLYRNRDFYIEMR